MQRRNRDTRAPWVGKMGKSRLIRSRLFWSSVSSSWEPFQEAEVYPTRSSHYARSHQSPQSQSSNDFFGVDASLLILSLCALLPSPHPRSPTGLLGAQVIVQGRTFRQIYSTAQPLSTNRWKIKSFAQEPWPTLPTPSRASSLWRKH